MLCPRNSIVSPVLCQIGQREFIFSIRKIFWSAANALALFVQSPCAV